MNHPRSASDGDLLQARRWRCLTRLAAWRIRIHLMVGAGKKGDIYLVDRDNMGHFNSGGDSRKLCNPSPDLRAVASQGVFDTPAYFKNYLYYWAFQ